MFLLLGVCNSRPHKNRISHRQEQQMHEKTLVVLPEFLPKLLALPIADSKCLFCVVVIIDLSIIENKNEKGTALISRLSRPKPRIGQKRTYEAAFDVTKSQYFNFFETKKIKHIAGADTSISILASQLEKVNLGQADASKSGNVIGNQEDQVDDPEQAETQMDGVTQAPAK